MARIAIHVDDRERAGAVSALLRMAPDFEVTVTRLKLGSSTYFRACRASDPNAPGD